MDYEELDGNSVVIKVRNGTERSDTNLCTTCKHHTHIRFAETGKEVRLCQGITYDRPMVLSGPVSSCNQFKDANAPTLYDMQKIAWDVTVGSKGGIVGFKAPEKNKDDY
jgi:hypothetical protein